MSAKEVAYLVSTNMLQGTKVSGRVWLRQVDVEERAAEEARWMTHLEAAELLEVSISTVERLTRAGKIVRRSGPRRWASLLRESVEQVAEMRRAEQRVTHAPKVGGPPDDGHVWLDATTTGLVLGLSARRVHQLAGQERLPLTEHGGRRWFLREHVEQVAAARAFSHTPLPVESGVLQTVVGDNANP